MGNTTWLTNGTQTFEVASGSPQEKRLMAQGYEACDPPIPGAPGEPDGSESLGSEAEGGSGSADAGATQDQGEAPADQVAAPPAAPKAKAPAAPKGEG